MSVNLQGVIAELMVDLFCINDSFSIGEKLTQIEKTAKKRFYNLSDKEIYEALRLTVKTDYSSDELYTDEELKKMGVI